jgi:hypothetical protein
MKKEEMMGNRIVALVGIMIIAASAYAFSGGPPDGKTGAPGEGTCNDCHDGSGGSTTITGPGTYVPGTTYTIDIKVADSSAMRWGFEAVVLDEDGDQAGSVTITDATNTQDSTSGGKTYVKHTSAGTFPGTTGSATWSFDWEPDAYVGLVTVYAAGNSANNDGDNTGDKISLGTLDIDPGDTAVETTSFGKVKSMYN